MKVFELTNNFCKNYGRSFLGPLKAMDRKQVLALIFLLTLGAFYFSGHVLLISEHSLENNRETMEHFGLDLESNLRSTAMDTIVLQKERQRLLTAIEERIVGYLYQIPDYTYILSLEPYLQYAPKLTEQIPSVVPLEKGDFVLSSKFGFRKHPISGRNKKHTGIDLAAKRDKQVYASASGTVLTIVHSRSGYGTYIILNHRFGFKTLYGHLNKILVNEHQKIAQHELIATVGSTGASTGYHLHYEIIKNGASIDPILSLGLKRKIYQNLFEIPKRYGTAKEK